MASTPQDWEQMSRSMSIFKTGLSQSKRCRNLSYHSFNKHIPLAPVSHFIICHSGIYYTTRSKIRFPLLVLSQDPAMSPHSGSQAEGTTALRSWLRTEWLLTAWKMGRELWRSWNERVKALLNSWTMHSCPGGQTLGERNKSFKYGM